jgi:hypothetical protein
LPLVRVQDDDLIQPPLELGDLRLESTVLLQQRGTAGAGLLNVFDGLLNLVGVDVGGLAAAASLLSLLADVAMFTEQDSKGIADPGEDG